MNRALLVLSLLTVACSSPPATHLDPSGLITSTSTFGGIDDGGADGKSGWWIPDDQPAPRNNGVAVVDSIDDRLIILGGVANDVWSFPLDQPDAGWVRLEPTGDSPDLTVRGKKGDLGFGPDLVPVFDSLQHRVLLVFRSANAIASLELSGAPRWAPIRTTGAPGNGNQTTPITSVVFDRFHNRLLAGTLDAFFRQTLISFDLDGGSAWNIEAANVLPVTVDEPNQRVLSRLGNCDLAWLSLDPLIATPASHTDGQGCFGNDYGPLTYDSDLDRVLQVDLPVPGDAYQQTFDFDGGMLSLWAGEVVPQKAAAADDPVHHRTVFFGGTMNVDSIFQHPSNVVRAIDYATLQVQTLSAAAVNEGVSLALVADPDGQSLIGVGTVATQRRTLDGGWTTIGEGLGLGEAAGVIDPLGGELWVYGFVPLTPPAPGAARVFTATFPSGSAPVQWRERTTLLNLPSQLHTAVFTDPIGKRVMLIGGENPLSQAPTGALWSLDDTGATLLSGGPGTPLLPYLSAPPIAIDPVGEQIFVFDASGRLHATPLFGPYAWVAPASPKYGTVEGAVYDVAGARLIGVSLYGTVFAYHPALRAWHRFCGAGFSPIIGAADSMQGPVIVGDQLVIALNGGLFAFDLKTPYCDGYPVQ